MLRDVHTLGFFSVRLSDALVYEERARAIVAGDWLGPADFMHAPLYAYALALVKALGGTGDWAPRTAQCVISSLGCVALALAGRRWFGPPVGWFAGVLLALQPHAVFSDTIIQKTSLTTFLSVLVLWLWGRAIDARTLNASIALGASMGLLMLDRQNAAVLLPVVIVGLWAGRGTGMLPAAARGRASCAAAVLLASVFVVSPWVARHRIVLERWVFAGPNLGQNFEMGNRPDATGTYLRPSRDSGVGEREQAAWTRMAQSDTGRTMTPGEVSDWFLARSLRWIRDDPGAWLRLTWKKTLMLVGAYEWPDLEDYYLSVERSGLLRALDAILHWGVVFPLACAGAALVWKDRRRWWPLAAWLLIGGASIVAFVVFGRYRAPLLPAVLLCAGVVPATLWSHLLGKPSTVPLRVPWIASLAALVVSGTLSNAVARRPREPRAFSRVNHALALADTRRLDEALAEVRRALAMDPSSVDALLALGSILSDLGRDDESLGAYRAAADADPRDGSARRGQARALIRLSRLREAESACAEALNLDPRDARALALLGQVQARSGRLGDAVRTLSQAAEADPALPDAQINLGNALLQSGSTEAARRAYEQALRLRPDEPDAHHNLGVLLAGAGEFVSAAEHFERVVSIDPSRTDSETAMIECWVRAGMRDRGVRYLESAIRRRPDRADLRAMLDRLRAQSKESRRP